jgi:hypothetical protein
MAYLSFRRLNEGKHLKTYDTADGGSTTVAPSAVSFNDPAPTSAAGGNNFVSKTPSPSASAPPAPAPAAPAAPPVSSSGTVTTSKSGFVKGVDTSDLTLNKFQGATAQERINARRAAIVNRYRNAL